MALAYSLLDVLADAHKQAIAIEFQQTETVFIDAAPGKEVRCRIGGHVIKMGVGELLYP